MGEVMPLTPEDVSNKRFTPVRLREGYDMGEVDQFLDVLEAKFRDPADPALARITPEHVRQARFGKPPMGMRGYHPARSTSSSASAPTTWPTWSARSRSITNDRRPPERTPPRAGRAGTGGSAGP